MFGHDWEKAQGTIIESRFKSHGNESATLRREYVVDVRPLDQPHAHPKRVVVQDPHFDSDWLWPDPGDRVTVEVHPDGRVRFDRHDPRLSIKATDARQQAKFNAALHQPPGSDPAHQHKHPHNP